MYDYIIVGQGIAGTVLSYTLLKQGKKILVTDSGNMDSCSSVAAGLFNPVTGKRMTKTWNANKLFPFFHQFYPEMEKTLGSKFFHPLPIYRPFGSIEEQNHWISHSENQEGGFVNTGSAIDQHLKQFVKNDFGGFETRYSGWVNVKEMILATKEYLKNQNAYLEKQFEFNDLIIGENSVQWQGYHANKLIFCEGFKAILNPYFSWIPYSPSKGEILIVRIKNFPEDTIINKNLFIVPIEKEIYKVGATFERTTDQGITEKGKTEIAEKLQNLIKIPFEILDHQAGIRPSVPDRRPLIGVHPENEKLFIFNGLGTKGISLSPYFANQFVQFLDGKMELDNEINIQRYYSLYFKLKGQRV